MDRRAAIALIALAAVLVATPLRAGRGPVFTCDPTSSLQLTQMQSTSTQLRVEVVNTAFTQTQGALVVDITVQGQRSAIGIPLDIPVSHSADVVVQFPADSILHGVSLCGPDPQGVSSAPDPVQVQVQTKPVGNGGGGVGGQDEDEDDREDGDLGEGEDA